MAEFGGDQRIEEEPSRMFWSVRIILIPQNPPQLRFIHDTTPLSDSDFSAYRAWCAVYRRSHWQCGNAMELDDVRRLDQQN